MIKYIKHRGFTDRLYFCNLMFAWVYTILCLIFSVMGDTIGISDYSFVSILAPVIWGEIATHTAFIVWKAKVENVSRNSMLKGAEWSGSINIDV